MGGLRPIGSEKLEGMDKIRRIMEIARYNENIPQSVNETKSSEYRINLADGNTYEIAKERRLAEETAKAEGKPEASIAKIVEGRVTGFVKEVSLLEQAFAKDAKKTVQQILDEAKTAVSAFNRFRVGQ